MAMQQQAKCYWKIAVLRPLFLQEHTLLEDCSAFINISGQINFFYGLRKDINNRMIRIIFKQHLSL